MGSRIIVVDFSDSLHTLDVQEAVHAVERQVAKHVSHFWGVTSSLYYHRPALLRPGGIQAEELTADAVIYVGRQRSSQRLNTMISIVMSGRWALPLSLIRWTGQQLCHTQYLNY